MNNSKRIDKRVIRIVVFIIFAICSLLYVSSCEFKIDNNPVEITTTYTVSFDTNCGISASDQTVDENGLVIEPILDRDDYRLDGWYLGEELWDFDNDKVTSDITLSAKWSRIYFASFDLNSGSGDVFDMEYVKSEDFTIPSFNITRHGYVFIGWSYEDKLYNANDKVIINDVTAKFIASYERICTISFDVNDGVGSVESISAQNNTSITLPKTSLTKNGFVFRGWSLEKDGNKVYDDNQTIFFDYDSNLVLYAKWEYDIDFIQITIDSIASIGEVSEAKEEAINLALKNYNNLDTNEKEQVSNYKVLEDAIVSLANIYINKLSMNPYSVNANDLNKANEVLKLVKEERYEELDNLNYLYASIFYLENQNKINNVNSNITDLITSVAKMYHYQGTQIQYDQYNARRNGNCKPEDATGSRIIYLDCSSYANSVYNYIYSTDVYSTYSTYYFDNYAKTNIGKKADVLYYVENSDYTTEASQKELLNKIYSELKPGDLVTYIHGKTSGSSGHVMVYGCNSLFIHCTGTCTSMSVGSYNPANFTDKATSTEAKSGGVILLNASEVFTNTSSSRYLFKKTSSDSVFSFSVIRMTNRTGLKINDWALGRYLISGVALEKSADTFAFRSVKPGQELTYTIALTNKEKNTYNKLFIEEELSENVEYVSCNNGGIYLKNSHKIVWLIDSIGASASKSINYTVRIKTDSKYKGTTILSPNSNVCGIPLNDCINMIDGNCDLSKVATEATKLVGSSFSNNLDFVKKVYKNAYNVNILSEASNTEGILKDLLSYYTLKEGSPYVKYLVTNLYGGLTVNTKNINNNKFMKIMRYEYLQDGDIILAHTSYKANGVEQFNCYLYQSQTSMLTANSGKVASIATTNADVANFIITLAAYDRFVILRPAMVI